MYKTTIQAIREFWRLPEGKQVLVLCFLIAIGSPFIAWIYFSGAIKENHELKIELKDERAKNDKAEKEYISNLIQMQNFHIEKFNEYRDKVEAKDAARSKQLENDYKEAIKTITQTKIVIDRTARGLDNNKN